jgi:hypothetical protein
LGVHRWGVENERIDLADCHECGCRRTVINGVCYVCFAELGERGEVEPSLSGMGEGP